MFSSMKLFLSSVVLAVLTISAYAQTTQPSASEWSAKSKRAAEDAVASKIEMMRAAAKRPALERVNPSMRELELVCSAALTRQVIVELSASSKPEHPEYTVGVARRPSAALEFFAPLFFDVPFKGINEWKKQVAPDCKNRKTETSR
jgi:hypothetical protein